MNNIVGILETNSKYRYGFTKHNVPLYLFKPFNKSLPFYIVGSKEKNLLQNYIVIVEPPNNFKETDNEKLERANLVKILGPCGNWSSELEALLYMYCPYHTQYKKVKDIDIYLNEDKHRLDLSSWTTINIDPEGCEDIDDCISYTVVNDEVVKLAISIADVSNIVEENSEIDRLASMINQTFYGETNQYMLPLKVQKACSLFPGEKRYCVSLIFNFNLKTLEFTNSHFENTIIQNSKSYTYESILDSDLHFLRRVLKSMSGSEDPHKWIELLMIFYNIEAAKILSNKQIGIFRRHKNDKITNDKVLLEVCPQLFYGAAEYCLFDSDLTHETLQVNEYCQVTSPIRRYVDLINQRCLKYMLGEKITQRTVDYCNLMNRNARKYSRDVFLLNLLRENKERSVSGIIVAIKENKYSVYIPEWKQIVKVRSMDKSYDLKQNVNMKYFFDSTKYRWKERIIFQII